MSVTVSENQKIAQIIEEKLEEILAQKLNEKITELNLVQKSPQPSVGTSLDEKFYLLNERIVRVEEELKHQRDLLIQIQKSSDKRFENMQKHMDKRFEAVDKRFEDMQKHMDKRFETVDKRFEDIYKYMDKRFDQVDKKFTLMQWVMAIGFVSLGTLVSVIKIFG